MTQKQTAQAVINQLPDQNQPEPVRSKIKTQEPTQEIPYPEELRLLETGLMHQIKEDPQATSKGLPARFKAAMDAEDRMLALLRLKAEIIAEDLPDADMALSVVAEAKDAQTLLEIIDQFTQAIPPEKG